MYRRGVLPAQLFSARWRQPTGVRTLSTFPSDELGLTCEAFGPEALRPRADTARPGRRGREPQQFKSQGSAQPVLNIQFPVYDTFYVQRHLLKRVTFKQFRSDAFNVWLSAGATTQNPTSRILRKFEPKSVPFYLKKDCRVFGHLPTKKGE